MPLPDRKQVPVRLSSDQIVRLERSAKSRGQSLQTFQQLAIVAAIEEAEAEMDLARDRKTRNQKDQETRKDERPAGLGLGMFRQNQEQRHPTDPTPAPVSPVVVHVGNSAAGVGDDAVAWLANHVVDGPDRDQEGRKRYAVDVIRSQAKSEEERLRLAQKLDDAIEAKTKNRHRDGSFLRMASDTFERLKEWMPKS